MLQAKDLAVEQERNRRLQTLMLQAEDLAVEQERNRVAREIHDGLGHHLSTLKLHLSAAARLMGSDPDGAAASFAVARGEAAAAQRELRRALDALMADHTTPPLETQLAELVRDTELAGVRISLTVAGSAQALPMPVRHALYRVAQEALTNVRRHARARQASVLLDFRAPRQVQLEILDDGVGLPRARAGQGYGLRTMEDRVKPLGGKIAIANQPVKGVRVWVTIPL